MKEGSGINTWGPQLMTTSLHLRSECIRFFYCICKNDKDLVCWVFLFSNILKIQLNWSYFAYKINKAYCILGNIHPCFIFTSFVRRRI